MIKVIEKEQYNPQKVYIQLIKEPDNHHPLLYTMKEPKRGYKVQVEPASFFVE